MAKFRVEIIVSYPCVIEAQTMEEAMQLAEDADWDDWPDDEAEVVEYCAELVIDDDDEKPKSSQLIPLKPRPKLTLVKDN